MFIILAARNYDEDSGWMQFLVFIIIAVFYAINSLIKKSRERKVVEREDDQQLEEMLEQPKYRQYQPVRPAIEKPVSSRQNKSADRGITVEPRQSRSGPRKRGGNVKTQETPYLTSPVPAFQPAVVGEPLEEQTVAAGKAERRKAVETLIDLNNPDELRKAVVVYEVIGKPISLRDE